MNLFFGDIVERNISIKVLASLGLVILAVGAIDFIFLILDELSDLGENYRFKDILYYSLLTMPYRLYDLSSYFCLIGVILGLGSLSDQGELLGTKVLGKSIKSIGLAAFRPIFLLMALGLIASEYFIPSLSQNAEETRLLKKNVLNYERNYWFTSQSKLISFKSAPNKELLKGVVLYEFNSKHEPLKLVEAKEARFVEGKWFLSGIESVSLVGDLLKKDNETNLILDYSSKDLSKLLSPKYLALSELYSQINLTSSEYRRDQLSLEFWRKILQPIVTMVLLLLALSFLFGPMRDHKSGQRVILGIAVAFGLDLCQKLFGSISLVSNLPALSAVLLPILLISFLAFFLLRRTS